MLLFSASPWNLRYAGVSALVLGASGFIGAWTVRALSLAGAEVHAVGRQLERTTAALAHRGASARVLTTDLSVPGRARQVINDVRPSIVFNLCGYGVDHSERDPTAMYALNVRLVQEVCESLAGFRDDRWRSLRLVHAGSALKYGQVNERLAESATARPSTDYGRAKLAGTDHVRHARSDRGLSAVVARLFTVYGAGEHATRLLPSLRRLAQSGGRLALTSGLQPRDFTYVEDAVEGLLRLGLADPPVDEVVNLATGSLTTVRTFAETAAAILGLDNSQLDFGALPTRDDEMWHQPVDITSLRACVSWVPATGIADGIRRTLIHADGA